MPTPPPEPSARFAGLSKAGLVREGPHPLVPKLSWQRIYRFDNGFGASVVDSKIATMGAAFELQIFVPGGDRSLDGSPQRGDAALINRLLQETAGRD